jgi:putative spermidine/putrescine transport system ATP-binding protein
MDEPLSNLDAALRLDMRAEIRRIHQEFGLTTLYVTHDQEEALSLADRLVVLDSGHVAQIGTPAELYESPASAYVAAFMGYRNILTLTADAVSPDGVRASRGGICLLGRPGSGAAIAEGAEVQAAVRPEDLRIVGESADAATGDSAVFDAVAEIVEYHGRTFHIDALTPAGDRVHLRTDQRVAPGDPLRLTADPERVLVFAGTAPLPETGADE